MLLTADLTGIQLDWVNGVLGADVSDKALPFMADRDKLGNGNIGSWRAHLNAMVTIIEQNLTSALIMEDDIDWDVRIKSQMYDFARSSQALLQPLSSNPSAYADPTFPSPSDTTATQENLYFDRLPSTVPPSVSPYGDGWDVLWVGHCNDGFFWGNPYPNSQHKPKGQVLHLNDRTVPENHYININRDDPRSTYPDHTRVVQHMMGGVCTFAYAVSHAGARAILYEMTQNFDRAFDNMLADFCDGIHGREYHLCLSILPQLFVVHRAAGKVSGDSDINNIAEGEVREEGWSPMLRWSARKNVKKLLRGETDFVDQFPDGSE
ncbi:hypothetical protein GP486_007140 [Trichoglossum hirsutum]|uniref:Glycosyltransferase family 25 protein n=1 Tax=Trichoglossum hirsutum TaxID=265104 RepID=A0A9P8IDA8_9PEZI|nr:hypothetical protein GP486_007140 [Trichoglossum hirsutum]